VSSKYTKDFHLFLKSEGSPVPDVLTQKIQSDIHSRLNPKASLVFAKLAFIHMGVGYVSLAICHQFDFNPFNTRGILSSWMMDQWGHHLCMVGCGVLFVALSVLASGLILNPEEIAALRRRVFLHNTALGLLSIGAFIFFGAKIIFIFALLWFLGAIMGGVMASELLYRLKKVGYSY